MTKTPIRMKPFETANTRGARAKIRFVQTLPIPPKRIDELLGKMRGALRGGKKRTLKRNRVGKYIYITVELQVRGMLYESLLLDEEGADDKVTIHKISSPLFTDQRELPRRLRELLEKIQDLVLWRPTRVLTAWISTAGEKDG